MRHALQTKLIYQICVYRRFLTPVSQPRIIPNPARAMSAFTFRHTRHRVEIEAPEGLSQAQVEDFPAFNVSS